MFFQMLLALPAVVWAAAPGPVSPPVLRFVYATGGTAPAAQTLRVSSGTAATGAPSAPWINATASGSTVSVTVNPTGLGLGLHQATLPVNQMPVPVTLVVFTPGSASQIFQDVAPSHPWADFIFLLSRFGVTIGCEASPTPRYCPADTVTQAQMAAFVIRALAGESFSFPAIPYFDDLASTNPLFRYVQKMREWEINPGCGGGRFCPNDLVTRGQMAQYIIRALFGDSFAHDMTPRFQDVPPFDPLFPYVQKMRELGITQGCTPTTYCPGDPVNREQMAAFLSRAFFRWGLLGPPAPPPPAPAGPSLAGCPVFPADNVWNTPVDHLPVHERSALWVQTIGANTVFHPDFGSGLWNGGPIGIPFVVVPEGQARVPISFEYADESDPGPYPIPPNPPIEGGNQSTGDRHILILEQGVCKLWEIYAAYPQSDGSWRAGSGAVFDLKVNGPLRPLTWTSADAAGLPILPGLIRYEEVAAGEIRHAIRFTAPQTRREFLWPARHFASSLTGAQYPPMGARFRLKASYDISSFHPQVQVILRAMKRYGIILADNGSSWYISGAPDERWNNTTLRQIRQLRGSDFEAVDTTPLMIDIHSGQARQP